MYRTAVLMSLIAAPAFACPQYDTVVAAVQAGDKAEAEVLYEEIVFSPACDGAIREWVGDYLARENFLAAIDAADTGEKRALLERALKFEIHWRSLAELGRLEWSLGNYTQAAGYLQRALNELAEGDQAHKAGTNEISEVYELATAALALADAPVKLPTTLSGRTGGIFTTSIRGFEVEEVNLPITFRHDSTEFDEIGATYAQTLAEHITQAAPPVVELGGHTDPTGPDGYNLELSRQRAARVEAFLRQNGYQGEIRVSGYGESRIPPAPPGIEPGSEEHYRIARRVAFSTE